MRSREDETLAELTGEANEDPEGMFPLRSAAEVGKLLGHSSDWVHSAAKSGALPFVYLGDDASRRGGPGRKVRMFRNDHVRQFVLDRTIE